MNMEKVVKNKNALIELYKKHFTHVLFYFIDCVMLSAAQAV